MSVDMDFHGRTSFMVVCFISGKYDIKPSQDLVTAKSHAKQRR